MIEQRAAYRMQRLHDAQSSLPDDIEGLKSLLLAKDAELSTLHAKLEQQSQFIEQLLEQIRLARHQQYGASSERLSRDQLALVFNEAEATQATNAQREAEGDDAVDAGEIVVPAHRRARGKRQPLPPELPRVDVLHELDTADCHCARCNTPMQPLSQKISEQLDIVPAQVRVLRHVARPTAAVTATASLRPRRCRRSRSPRAWPAPARWRTLPLPSTSTGCRCTGSRGGLSASAWICRARRWPAG